MPWKSSWTLGPRDDENWLTAKVPAWCQHGLHLDRILFDRNCVEPPRMRAEIGFGPDCHLLMG